MATPTTSVHDLKTLVLSHHPLVVIETVEETRVEELVAAVGRDLDLPFFTWSVTRGLARHPRRSGIDGTAEPDRLLGYLEELEYEALVLAQDLARHLHPETGSPVVARRLREVARAFARGRSTLVLTGERVELPAEVEHKALRYLLALPGPEELRRLLADVVASVQSRQQVKIDLVQTEVAELIRALAGLTLNQARQTVAYCLLEDGRLDADDVRKVLARKGQLVREGGVLELYPAADNRYELGGFGRLKAWLDRARVGYSEHARSLDLPAPRGILLVGVQGCGKSLAAKVVARRWDLPLLKLDAGRLYDKYIGETEKNFRQATRLAESMAPAVLWIDEIERAFAPSQHGDSDGGLSRRLFGSLLTWLQERRREVFVVATANDLSALPAELLRKGRFDEVFFVDLPDEPQRREIFAIHLRLRRQDPDDYDLATLAAASTGFSGAEIEQVVIGGLYRALHLERAIGTEVLLEEAAEIVPLSVARREEIERLRDRAKGRFVAVA